MSAKIRRYFWAVISPSALDSIAYLESNFATAAAATVSSGQYPALVLEPRREKHPFEEVLPQHSVAYLVHPASFRPLPETYLSISPCRLDGRDPLEPHFAWPFGECVIHTGQILVFNPVGFGPDFERVAKILPWDIAESFSLIQQEDSIKQADLDYQKRLASERVERGDDDLLSESSWWTTFSRKSRVAQVVPGQFFPPSTISVKIRYDIDSLHEILPSSQCFEDVREIERLRAQFSRPETERTICWALSQAPFAGVAAFLDSKIEQLCDPDIINLMASFDRPHSPDREADSPTAVQADEDDLSDDWGEGAIDNLAHFLPPPPWFEPNAVQIMYFDLYGTLIDSESGIFDALAPLLSRCHVPFERSQALSFYFESEADAKQRTPTAPYSEIMVQSHTDMARRLGLIPVDAESSAFASSIVHWPLVDGSVECLRNLRSSIPALVALVDLDHNTLIKTAAFSVLAPYFAEVFTWDACHAYRPDLGTLHPPLLYHDSMTVLRGHRCLVSNNIFRDLEPACGFGVPAIWMRYPASLASNVPIEAASFAFKTCENLRELVLAM